MASKNKPTAERHPLIDGTLPIWASNSGQDEYGTFVEFTLDHICQRMRWINPGRFLMGSLKMKRIAMIPKVTVGDYICVRVLVV